MRSTALALSTLLALAVASPALASCYEKQHNADASSVTSKPLPQTPVPGRKG